MASKIRGLENMSKDELNFELQRGGRFVLYYYTVSVVVMTFRKGSDIFFLHSGESAAKKGLPFTLISLVAGWWGIPFGPIFTIQSLWVNLRGGKDVTATVVASLNQPVSPPPPKTYRSRGDYNVTSLPENPSDRP